MSITLTYATLTALLTILGFVINTSIRFGRFMQQFDELRKQVRIHERLLHHPMMAKTATEKT